MSARKLAYGAFSFKPEVVERSTTEGAEIIVGTTVGYPTTEVAGSEKPNFPS